MVPRLSNGTVTLRGPIPDDAAAMVELACDPEMMRFTTVPRPYGAEQAQSRIGDILSRWAEPSAQRSWVIETTTDGRTEFAGLIDLRPGAAPTFASLGYALHPGARGRGVMTAAVRLVAAYAFEQQPWGAPIARLHWTAVVGNWASRRVAWASGFAMHGTLPGSHLDPADHARPPLDSWQASLGAGEPMAPRTPWFEPPVIEEADLRLRPWRDDDLEAIEPRDDPEHWMPAAGVLRRDTFSAWLLTRRERMANGMAIEWCIADRASDHALGGVLLFVRAGTLTDDVAELGYQLFPSARGRGVATRAARLASTYALRTRADDGLGLRRLVAETAADNTASNRVLEHCGFIAFGREQVVDLRADGTYSDGLHWELLS